MGSSILGNHLLGYDAAGVLLTPDILPLAVRQARDSLTQQLEQSVDDEQRALRVLNVFTGDLTQTKIDALTKTIIDLQFNENALRTSGLLCFEFWEQCLQEVTNLYLRPIDRTLLVLPPPTTIVKGYFNHKGTVHYSNGVGQYWPVFTQGHHARRDPSTTVLLDTIRIDPVYDPKSYFRKLNVLELTILPKMSLWVSQYASSWDLLRLTGLVLNSTRNAYVRDVSIFLPQCTWVGFTYYTISQYYALLCL